MDNKFNNMLEDFLKNTEAKDEKELNEKLQEFMKKVNSGEIEYENTPLDDAYELLEKAEHTKSKKLALKYAKEAYDTCEECFDALLFQIHMQDNALKSWELLEKGLEKEKKRLEKKDYFSKDNIGHFYGIFETRPYIRGLYVKAELLTMEGKFKQAINVCKDILKLNESDNTGVRYFLMAIYSYLEDEENLLKLYKKFPEENLEMLIPIFILYYKIGNDKKAKEYLKRINKANPNFLKLFKGTLKDNENLPKGYYSKGDSSEVLMYINNYTFLLISVPHLNVYVLENQRKRNNI